MYHSKVQYLSVMVLLNDLFTVILWYFTAAALGCNKWKLYAQCTQR